jgi:magnesium transporter
MIRITYKSARDSEPQNLTTPKKGSWIDATNPDAKDLADLAKLLDLDEATLKDALDPYEAPRIEVDQNDVYIFTRYCRPGSNKSTSTEPLLILYTPTQVVTVSPKPAEFLDKVAEASPTTTQKTKFVLGVLKEVNATYMDYLNKVTRETFRIRRGMSQESLSGKDFLDVIDIEEDLNEMLTSLQPYSIVLESIFSGKYMDMHAEDQELVEDLKLSTSEIIELTRSRLRTLENIRDVHSTISTNSLNATFKRLTSISIFMAIPTIVGGLYGMNVALPFDKHPAAFWIVLAVISTAVFSTIVYFRRKNWL